MTKQTENLIKRLESFEDGACGSIRCDECPLSTSEVGCPLQDVVDATEKCLKIARKKICYKCGAML